MSARETDFFGLSDEPAPLEDGQEVDLFPNAREVNDDPVATEQQPASVEPADPNAPAETPPAETEVPRETEQPAETPETSAEETAPEQVPGAQEVAGATADGAVPPAAPTEPETPASDAARRWGPDGRFTTAEELEQSYTHLLSLDGRRSGEVGELRSQVAQLQQLVRSASQALQARNAQPAAPPQLDPAYLAQIEASGGDPEQIRAAAAIAAQVAQTQTQQAREQMLADQMQGQEQAEIAQQRAAASSALTTFAAAHPEITTDRNLEANIERTFTELGFVAYDPADWVECLEIAHEAVQNPAVGNVLRAMPELAATDYGLAIARQLAAGVQPANGGAAPAAPAPNADAARQAALAAAQVEHAGGNGAPTPGSAGETPTDGWDAVKALARQENAQSRETVFGV